MLDFMTVAVKPTKSGVEYYPKFKVVKSKDLMIRGGDFYAIWDEKESMWSTDEQDVIHLVDNALDEYVKTHSHKYEGEPIIKYMWDSDTLIIDKWHKYCQKQLRDNYQMLDEELIFSNTELTREKYASKRLTYPLEAGRIDAFDKIIGTLYTEEERHKIEWAIGSIVSGDSKSIQKFMVLYGAHGTGKSTILNIIQQLFEGYSCVFDAKSLGANGSNFALESFRNNPLVAIQHDGDLSRIEDNTRLNSLVSHEVMTVNEKYAKSYENRFKAFLFMGTNRPVKITDAKSGLLRRLIDVHPSGNTLPKTEYVRLYNQVSFELGAIAHHCLKVYKEDPTYYDDYVPRGMMAATNDFYDFVADSYSVFKRENSTTLKSAWEMYKTYVDEAKLNYPFTRRVFAEELKNYFDEYSDRFEGDDGSILKRYYSGFKTSKFETEKKPEGKIEENKPKSWIEFKDWTTISELIFEKVCIDCLAQYTNDEGTPLSKWEWVKTKLKAIDPTRLHYVKVPENHIVIDFDIKGPDGEKSFELNLEAASKWPPTYAELSKSGAGIHLHYIYTGGDVAELSRVYDDEIEVKVFTGNSSLRRMLTKCNDLPIANISSGLPLKENNKNMINFDGIKSERALRTLLKRHLNKEIMVNTKPSIDMMYKVLEEAYESGLCYDVSDLKEWAISVAIGSTNQSDACLKLVDKAKWKSEIISETSNESGNDKLIFFDVEVFPNLFLVCWKVEGDDKPVVVMVNPKTHEIEELLRYKLVGFNNKEYDNHMLYACLMGYDNSQLYELSKTIVGKDKYAGRKAKFSQAFDLSYTDIYDFASAGNKKSLKKLEIEMGISHKELGKPWDEPVDESEWDEVIEYCKWDVIATEKAFRYLKGDWLARQILADIAEMKVNDSTNNLSTKIIFGNNRNPQNEFNYRDLSEPVHSSRYNEYREMFGPDYRFRVFNAEGLPEYRDYIPGEVLPKGWSILPFFPGYTFDLTRDPKSVYLDEEIGEGGRVYSEPGIYWNVWDADVTGQHPSSIIAEVLFGPRYTKAFADIVSGRVSIKHKSWSEIDDLFDGKLKPYIQKVINGELTSKELANALKTVVNSVYGLTSAAFTNAFRDPRNKDNIVAKRGALFMTLLKREVQKKGFTVAHIKTDSIKIPNATDEIREFVLKFGKEYGYSFETEAEFERFCLVNKAVYIAKIKDGDWTATGDQFAVPYVFKTLFSKEPIEYSDLCETFNVKTAIYLDMNEDLPDVSMYENEVKKLESKYKKGTLSDTTFESECAKLNDLISEGHDYRFVGKTGQFCPIKPGKGGGVLWREQNGKYNAVAGTTGFRWLESEMVLASEENKANIDRSFYRKLVDDAVTEISKYGDFDEFVNGEVPPINNIPSWMNIPEGLEEEELPWD